MNGKNNYPTFYDRYGSSPAQNDLQATPDLSFQAQPEQEEPKFNPWMEMANLGMQSEAEKEQKMFNSPWEIS